MKKMLLLILIFISFAAHNAVANMPMPKGVNNAFETVRNTIKKTTGELNDGVIKPMQKNIEEGTKAVKKAKDGINKAKDIADKVKGTAEKAAEAIKDPKGAATSALASVADVINDMSLADDLQKEFVYTENITPEQYQEKMSKKREMLNKRSADTYAMAFTHRRKLLEEGMQDEPKLETEDQDMVLNAINLKVSEIVERLNYMQMLEAMTDELDYTQALTTFSTNDEEEGDE